MLGRTQQPVIVAGLNTFQANTYFEQCRELHDSYSVGF